MYIEVLLRFHTDKLSKVWSISWVINKNSYIQQSDGLMLDWFGLRRSFCSENLCTLLYIDF